MRKTWISAALAPALALLADPLWARQRAPTTATHVVACSGTFAKDSSAVELATAFNSKNVTFADVRPLTAPKSRLRYCSLMIRSVDSKSGGPIEPTVAIFI